MRIAVIGGDKRMLFAAKEFLNEGHEVCIAGFDHLLSLCDIRVFDFESAAGWAEMIVLPVRPLRGELLNAPCTNQALPIRELLQMTGKKPVYSGCGELVARYTDAPVYDYTLREDFSCRNAELTAEGALGLVLSDYEGSVYGSRILVTGYGRIGSLLSEMLYHLGADVTVAARKLSDLSVIGLKGMTAKRYSELDHSRFDIIFNTVPSLVLDENAVSRMRGDVFIVDLASLPGGVDFDAAARRGLSCVHAISLPGKTAPLAAGRIIKDTILFMAESQ